MATTENFNAFMAPDKMREDSATIAEETSMFGQRKSYIANDILPAQTDGVVVSEEGSFDEGSQFEEEEDEEDDRSISSNISHFSVKASKVKIPKFKDKWTGYQWCRRQTKIIEKMVGSKLERKIKYGDDPNEFAFYLKCQEQDAYVDSTCKWLTQTLIGVCGGMESASRFMRKYMQSAPNFDGLTDNNMAVLDEYEVLFMQMDETVGERFREIDPIWRVCLMFLFQLVSTAAVNYGTKAMMNPSSGGGLGALGLDTSNIQSMAQNMSDNVLNGLDGNVRGANSNDMATMMQGMMKNIMPMMQNMMSGMNPDIVNTNKKHRKTNKQQQQQVINLSDEGDEDQDNLPLLQTIAEKNNNDDNNDEQDEGTERGGVSSGGEEEEEEEGDDFEIKETAGQSSHTVDLNDFQ